MRLIQCVSSVSAVGSDHWDNRRPEPLTGGKSESIWFGLVRISSLRVEGMKRHCIRSLRMFNLGLLFHFSGGNERDFKDEDGEAGLHGVILSGNDKLEFRYRARETSECKRRFKRNDRKEATKISATSGFG